MLKEHGIIVYRDMTFCARAECAKHSTCDIALTRDIHREAQEAQLPLSLIWGKPECFEPQQKKEEEQDEADRQED